jgi:hypothetical protein
MLTMAAWAQSQSGHVGFMVDNVALVWVISELLEFPLPAIIPPATPHSLIILPMALHSLNADSANKQAT